MEIKGIVKVVGEVKTGTKKDGSQWSMQTIVIHDESGKYPKDLAVDVSDTNCGKAVVGADITAQYDVSSREWQGKWFTSARAWKIEIEGITSKEIDVSSGPNDGENDLPF